MPPQSKDPHTANDPSLEDSSDDQVETILDILATWSLALKHLDGITKLGDRKYNWRLDAKLHMVIQSSAKLISQDNVNYLFMQPANAKSWRIHELYNRFKKDLTKMEHIAESTLLYKANKICMFNADICKLIDDINEHWAKAKTIGYNLM
ncbi:uncharacterized protein UBRO2_04310 [Ustilago bromivora]|uniref:Uncharacterized protein n=1 Tax=Ustilago bromivora TaxID=307758 RepID=A0A8H8QPR7_9BASI|nr:uncharacterized protein UBRO2_04310 [Ustilago bromivora]